jgi:hypothetical protein
VIIELRLSDEDRARLGGEEWIRFDTDKVMHTSARQLKTWEQQTNYPIDRAIASIGTGGMSAIAMQIVVWLARKQSGDNRNNQAGTAEPFTALDDIMPMLVESRYAADVPVEAEDDDVDPPDTTPSAATTPEP